MIGFMAGLLLASAAPPSPRVFDIAAIGFTERCEPNAAFKRLIDVLIRQGARSTESDYSVLNAIAGDTSHSLTLDKPVAWKGLHLRGVELQFGIERGPANYGLVFDETPARAVAVLNGRGFRLPAPDKTRDVQGLENYARIGVSASGTRSALWCARD